MNTITFTWIGDFIQPEARTSAAIEHAKNHLKTLGWSQRRAAERLGVSQEHLNRVLSGERHSLRLLNKIAAIAPSPTPYHNTGFARRGVK